MLRKLMKHELRATGRIMFPTLLFMLITALGGNFAVHNLLETGSQVLNILGAFLLMAFMVTLIGAFIIAFVLMIHRFYKNLLRDEGYLMMTLPATVHQHIFSKLLTSLIWSAATAAVMMLALFVLAFDIEFVGEIMRALPALLEEVRIGVRIGNLNIAEVGLNAAGYLAEFIALIAVAEACICLNIYAALAVGHSFSSHKMLKSVAAFFMIQILMNLIGNGAGWMLAQTNSQLIADWMNEMAYTTQLHGTYLMMIGLTALYGAVHYAIAAYFLKNRLNLD